MIRPAALHHGAEGESYPPPPLLFERTRPDLVILDVLLPDRDGFDLMVDLLDHDRSAKIVVFSRRASRTRLCRIVSCRSCA